MIRILDILADFISNQDRLIKEAAIFVHLNDESRTMKGKLGVNMFETLLRYIERYLAYIYEFIFLLKYISIKNLQHLIMRLIHYLYFIRI